MRFPLIYRGLLAPWRRSDVAAKRSIRREFQPQLSELWRQFPLFTWAPAVWTAPRPQVPEPHGTCLHEAYGFTWAPLVNDTMQFTAGLDVRLLRRGVTDQIDRRPWDLDHHIRTLFDALGMPCQPEEVGADVPGPG